MKTTRPAFVLFALLVLTSAAHAQTARSGGGAADAQLLQQLQQLASERTQLQAENAKLKKELEDVKKKIKGLESDRTALNQRAQSAAAALAQSSASKEGLEQSLSQQRTRMEELIAKFRETATTLRDVETDRAQARTQLATREQELKTCVEKNLALYKVNSEALDRLENQSFWTSVARKEPFTQLKRTQIENLVDEYRGRADDNRIEGQGSGAASPASKSSPRS